MRAILVCPGEGLRKGFEDSVTNHSLILSKRLDAYPSTEGFSRLIRSWAPEVIFLSLEDPDEVGRLCDQLDAEFPELQRIGLGPAPDAAHFRLALRFRMRDLLSQPFDEPDVTRILADLHRHLESHPASIGCCDRFYAFMPAKAGAGASTVAANVSRALQSPEGSRPLLVDFDLHSGITGFLFKMEHDYTLTDALRMSKSLDDESWQRLIKKIGHLDVLLSGAPQLDDEQRNPRNLAYLFEFLRRNYTVITADLPDSFDATTLAVLREVNHVFLVTTPELPALRLARQKATMFEKLDLSERASLIVNRTTRRMELSLEEISQTVGLPIAASFPCDYAGVTKSIRDAEQPGNLTAALQGLSDKMLHKRMREEKKARFIERFAIVPMRYSFR
jgi:pilus assembly protein CpaE